MGLVALEWTSDGGRWFFDASSDVGVSLGELEIWRLGWLFSYLEIVTSPSLSEHDGCSPCERSLSIEYAEIDWVLFDGNGTWTKSLSAGLTFGELTVASLLCAGSGRLSSGIGLLSRSIGLSMVLLGLMLLSYSWTISMVLKLLTGSHVLCDGGYPFQATRY